MQMEIDFEAGLIKQFPEIMDMVRHCAYACGRQLKGVAADMDLSQSELSRKLAQNPNDPRHLNVEELPALIEACGDKGRDIIYWLVEKYLEDPKRRQDRAREALLAMAPAFMALMQEVMPDAGSDKPAPSLREVRRG